MNEKNTSNKKNQTQDSNDTQSKSIYQRIDDKRNKLIEIHGSLAIWFQTDIPYSKKAKVKELQDRLDFRILEAEESLLDDKLQIYGEVLSIVKA